MPLGEIEVIEGPQKGERFSIGNGEVILGRGEECGVHLVGYEQVSREHARIRCSNGLFQISDSSSRNGLFVDEVKVSTASLRNGALIRLGDCRLRLTIQTAQESIPAPHRPNRTILYSVVGVSAIAVIVLGILLSQPSGNKPTVVDAHDSSAQPKVLGQARSPSSVDMQTLAQSVVFIQSVSVDGSGGEGTGFCAGRPDLVLTNAHVALGGATQDLNGQVIMPQDILVTLDPGRDAERKQAAKLINVDRNFDLALLQLPHGRLSPLVVGKTESLKPLDKITSIGFPRGSTMSTKHGAPEVSYMSLDVEGVKHDDEGKPTFLQVGGSTTNGNSGGPVVDSSGHVVGITTLKVSEASIALCIPSNLIETFLSKSLAKLEAEEKEGSNVP